MSRIKLYSPQMTQCNKTDNDSGESTEEDEVAGVGRDESELESEVVGEASAGLHRQS